MDERSVDIQEATLTEKSEEVLFEVTDCVAKKLKAKIESDLYTGQQKEMKTTDLMSTCCREVNVVLHQKSWPNLSHFALPY